jgi:hypothetical protein
VDPFIQDFPIGPRFEDSPSNVANISKVMKQIIVVQIAMAMPIYYTRKQIDRNYGRNLFYFLRNLHITLKYSFISKQFNKTI